MRRPDYETTDTHRKARPGTEGIPYLVECPACATATAHRYLYSKNDCDVLRCDQCGLGRCEARAFDPAAYYTRHYFSGQHQDGYADYLGSEAVLRREFGRTLTFIRSLVKGGVLLEIGCAYGFFLQEASPFFAVSGIELSEHASTYCRNAGLPVICSSVTEQALRDLEPPDVIVFLDVVEHLPNPRDTLALCAQRLKSGGIMVITTGDFSSLMARLTRSWWRLMTPPQHLWFFTPESVRRMASSFGMIVESCDYPWKIVPLSLITFQLRRILRHAGGGATASHIGIPANLFDAMRIVLRKP